MNDIHYGLRIMRKSPQFTCTVVLTVGLAIGANITVFSVVNAVLLRPLPFSNPGRVVQVAEKNDKFHIPSFGSSVLNFLSWREQARSFQDLAAAGSAAYTLTGSGDPEQISGNFMSPALMRVLGVAPIAGRAFSENDENPGTGAVVMVGDGLWKRQFASDPGLVERTITLNGIATTVVGIAPASPNLISPAGIRYRWIYPGSASAVMATVGWSILTIEQYFDIERSTAFWNLSNSMEPCPVNRRWIRVNTAGIVSARSPSTTTSSRSRL